VKTELIRIVIGADHRGYAMKEWLKANLKIPNSSHPERSLGVEGPGSSTLIEWLDVGAASDERSDYPEFAIAAARAINAGDVDCGILLCGTGVGMAIAANRFAGIYAGVVWNTKITRETKQDDNINVLVFPSDYVNDQEALEMAKVWLTAEFKEGRYQKRIDMIDAI